MSYNYYTMKEKTRNALFEAWAYADWKDKSTEWMFQYMADTAKVEYDVAVDFVVNTTDEQRSQWYKDNPDWYKKYNE